MNPCALCYTSAGGFDRSGSPTECALLELPHRLGWGWGWGHGGSSTSTAAVVAAPAAPAAASAESAAGAAAAGVGHCGGDTAAARDSGVACSTSKSSSNAGTHILQLVPFSSARKRMSVVVDGPCQAGLGQLPAFFGDSYPPHSRTLSSSIGTMQSVDMEDARSGGPGDSSIGSSSGTANSSSARVGSVRASDEDGGTSAALEISASSSNGSSSSAGAGPPLSPVRVLTKGAAELVLERCSWVLLPRGEGQDGGGGGEVAGDTEVRPLSAEQKQRLLASFRGEWRDRRAAEGVAGGRDGRCGHAAWMEWDPGRGQHLACINSVKPGGWTGLVQVVGTCGCGYGSTT